MDTENIISLKLDRILKHKYRTDLAESGTLDDDEFRKIWRLRNKTGEIDGIFYVATVKTDLGSELLSDIFGDVHMAMHLNLRELRITRRDLRLRVEANLKTTRLYNQGKIWTRKLKRENTALKTTLSDMRERLAKLDNKGGADANRSRSDTLEKENRTLHDRYRESENDKLKLNDQIRFLEREKRQLEIDFFTSQSTKERLAGEIKELITQIATFVECRGPQGNQCPRVQVCAKRILVVGGITKMKHFYRELVKSIGGEFEYHDGYMKSGQRKLEVQVRRSDLVLCPVNCNSHGACHKVKGLCKKFDIPVKMLAGSGLGAISNAIVESGATIAEMN